MNGYDQSCARIAEAAGPRSRYDYSQRPEPVRPNRFTEAAASSDLPPWLRKDEDQKESTIEFTVTVCDDGGEGMDGGPDSGDWGSDYPVSLYDEALNSRGIRRDQPRTRMAESPLAPQRRFRDTVDNSMGEADLTAKQRKALPASDFALSGRRYPMDTPARARAALSRIQQFGSPQEIRQVKSAVKRKYPDMDVS